MGFLDKLLNKKKKPSGATEPMQPAAPKQVVEAPPEPVLEIPAALRPTLVSRADFEPLGVLGRGSFAAVVLVRAKVPPPSPNRRPSSLAPTGFGEQKDLYAMKIVQKRKLLDAKRMRDVFTERNVLTRSSHPYLLKLHYTFQSEHKLFFVMDYMPGGDLRGLINSFRRRREPMPYEMARLFAAQVTLALAHLHDHGILYRDLKPENILLDANGHCALADFGLSKDFGNLWLSDDGDDPVLNARMNSMRANSFVGSPLYVAPEVLLRHKYSRPVDFWGLGILIFTLLFGAEPFRGQNPKEIFDRILGADVRFPRSILTTHEAMDIIVRLLHKDPAQRLGVPEIFGHPFFRGVDFSAVLRKDLIPQGWIPPTPPPVLTGDDASRLSARSHTNSHTRRRGNSEVYTPDSSAYNIPCSQQVFFENFSWANVDHMQELDLGADDPLLDDLDDDDDDDDDEEFGAKPLTRNDSSDFYDRSTSTDLAHSSFTDGAATTTLAQPRRDPLLAGYSSSNPHSPVGTHPRMASEVPMPTSNGMGHQADSSSFFAPPPSAESNFSL